jgi:hypothetical protein
LTGGNYTLRLTASDGEITTFADLTASITGGSTYDQWLLANGLPPDASGYGSRSATPLNDGISNAMKFALGLDLNTRGLGDRLTTGKVNDSGQEYLALTYTTPEPAPSGVIYTVTTSPDLVNWSALETVPVSSTTSGGVLRTTTVRDTQSAGTTQKRFIRLEVTLP